MGRRRRIGLQSTWRFFFSSRRRHTRSLCDWSSDVCSSDLIPEEMIHYGMTKAAELALVNGIARLTKGTGVTVNAVLPGPTASEGVTEFVDRLEIGRASCRERV